MLMSLMKKQCEQPFCTDTHIYTGSPFSFWNLVDLKYGFDYDLKRAVKDSECYLFYMKNTAL